MVVIEQQKVTWFTTIVVLVCVTLDSVLGLEFTLSPVSRSVQQDNPASFGCAVIGTPLPDIVWYKDDLPLNETDQSRYTVDKSINTEGEFTHSHLKVLSVQRSDGGLYQCKALNEDEEILSDVAVLTYYGPPLFTVSPASQNVSRNTPFDLECNAEGHPYPITITWYYNGIILADEPTYVLEEAKPDQPALLNVPGVIRRSTYTCEASNDNGRTFSQSALINVKEKPGTPRNLTIEETTAHSMELSWQLGFVGYSSYRFCIIQYIETAYYEDGMADYWLSANTSLDGYLVTNLRALTGYKFRISCTNEVGSSPWTPLTDGETMMGVPSVSPGPISVTLVNNVTIGIAWTAIESSNVNGILSGYKVQYINVDTREEIILQFDSDITYATVINIDPYGNFSITVWGYTAGGDGVKSELLVVGDELLEEKWLTSRPPQADIGKTISEEDSFAWYFILISVVMAIIIVFSIIVVVCICRHRKAASSPPEDLEACRVNKQAKHYSFINPMSWRPVIRKKKKVPTATLR